MTTIPIDQFQTRCTSGQDHGYTPTMMVFMIIIDYILYHITRIGIKSMTMILITIMMNRDSFVVTGVISEIIE